MPLGTQIVTRIDTQRPEGGLLQMAGAVAVILQMPSEAHGQYPFHEMEYTRLQRELEQSSQDSHLPERPSSKEALNDLLVRVRLNGRFGQKVSD